MFPAIVKPVILGFAVIAFLAALPLPANQDEDWKLAKEKNGFRIFTRKSERSAISDSRAIGVIKTSIDGFLSVIRNVREHKNWMDRIKISEPVLENSPGDFVAYYLVTAPWPLTNRDMVLHYNIKPLGKNRVRIEVDSKPDLRPESAGIIRIRESKTVWELTEDAEGLLQVDYYTHSEPGGSLPDWVVNIAIAETPLNTLSNLKRKLEN